jgi:spermidine synthase
MTVRFYETLHGGFAQAMDVVGPMLADEQTDFQAIRIFDTPLNGRVLILDNIVQLTDRDEASYSEMLTHLPMLEHGNVKRIMIVGGGDGAVAEEALKHAGVERVDLVEIDPRVIALCREHFAHVNGRAFDDARLQVHTEDAFAFLQRVEAGTYDLVIADRPDPIGPAEVLFADPFYEAVARALAPEGYAVFQTGVPFFQAEELTDTLRQLARAFTERGVYLTVTPTYSGGFMTLCWASNGGRLGTLDEATLKTRFGEASVSTDYYTPGLHRAAFALPAWIERLVPRGSHTGPGAPRAG